MTETLKLTLVTEPSEYPVTLEEVKAQCRIDGSNEDAYLTSLIKAAALYTERRQWRALITQTWDLVMDEFPEGDTIIIPKPPLQSLSSITYTDSDGNTSTFSSDSYIVDTDSEPGRVVLKSGESWPSDTLQEAAAVRVRFVAGYGDNPSDVPETTRIAILLLVAHWYENREPVALGTGVREIPFGLRALIDLEHARRFV